MKKFLLIIVIIISIVSSGAYASEIEYGYIDIKAIIPENFDTSIMINFTLEDGTNALYTLEKVNAYKNEEKMLVGNHKVDFISIYNDLKGRYRVENEKEIIITKDTSTPFEITIVDTEIDNKKTLDEKTDILLGKTEEKFNENIEKLQETKKEDDENVSNEKVENKESKGFFKKYIVTILIAAILIIATGIIKFKQILYKD